MVQEARAVDTRPLERRSKFARGLKRGQWNAARSRARAVMSIIFPFSALTQQAAVDEQSDLRTSLPPQSEIESKLREALRSWLESELKR